MEQDNFLKKSRSIGNVRIVIGTENLTCGQVYNNDSLKQRLVEDNPIEAEKLFTRWGDEDEQGKKIGEMYIKKYAGHKEYGSSAYQIARILKLDQVLGIEHPSNAVLEEITHTEERLAAKHANEHHDHDIAGL